MPSPLIHVKVVAFDLDNTLIDILYLKVRAAGAAAWALADAGMDIHPHKAARAILDIALQNGLDRPDVVDEYVRRKLGDADPRFCAIGRHAYEQAEDSNARAYPRAHSTLLELTRRGYTLVLITDATRERAMRRLQAARLSPFFQHIITLEETGTGKATTAPYASAASALGVRPRDIVMVGDNPRLDIGSARAFGCKTILANYGLQPHFVSHDPRHAPTTCINWLDELLKLLPGRRRAENPLTSSSHAPLGDVLGEATVGAKSESHSMEASMKSEETSSFSKTATTGSYSILGPASARETSSSNRPSSSLAPAALSAICSASGSFLTSQESTGTTTWPSPRAPRTRTCPRARGPGEAGTTGRPSCKASS